MMATFLSIGVSQTLPGTKQKWSFN